VLGVPWKALAHVVGASAWLLAACAGPDHGATAQSRAAQPKGPNPAARKCLEDGYELEPVFDPDGVPIDHQCVDKTTGKRCEVWEYFRGKCRLRETPQRPDSHDGRSE
jgi:putative hemolysin